MHIILICDTNNHCRTVLNCCINERKILHCLTIKKKKLQLDNKDNQAMKVGST